MKLRTANVFYTCYVVLALLHGHVHTLIYDIDMDILLLSELIIFLLTVAVGFQAIVSSLSNNGSNVCICQNVSALFIYVRKHSNQISTDADIRYLSICIGIGIGIKIIKKITKDMVI